jgi:hypothetical protein
MSSSIFKKSDHNKPVRSLDRILNNVSDPVQPNMPNMQNMQNTQNAMTGMTGMTSMTGGAAAQNIPSTPAAGITVMPVTVIPSILETETIEAMLNKIETDLFGNESHVLHESHELHDSHKSHELQNTNTSHDLYSINNSSIRRVIA